MKANEFIREGADFYGYYKDPKDPEGKTMTYPDGMKFNIGHVSNVTARMILGSIGLEKDFENNPSHLIDDFIKATEAILRINAQDKGSVEYENVKAVHDEANRFKDEHPEITHVGFN